jgi:hypothetical protein
MQKNWFVVDLLSRNPQKYFAQPPWVEPRVHSLVRSKYMFARLQHNYIYCQHTIIISGSRDSSVDIATGYKLDVRDSIPGRGKIILPTSQLPKRLWCPPRLLFKGHRGPLSRGCKAVRAWIWQFTSIYYWGQEWWSCVFTLQYVFLLWCLIKHRDNFVLYLYDLWIYTACL